MKKVSGVLVIIFVVFGVLINSAKAYQTLTAQEAYNMLASNPNAYLIDVRTTAEFLWVGTCKLPDGTTPYNIPWKIWAYQFVETDGKVKAGGIVVKHLFLNLVKRTFPKGSTLILMCRSGHRSTYAAEYLEEELGEDYYTIYEIDNPLKNEENGKGGSGGFQGSSSVDPNENGYRGYPGRLPDPGPGISLETVTDDIDDPDDSVSWMDTGLPITQSVDKDRIWLYMLGGE